MANGLGMEAIAEGVESDAGAEEIYEMGCSLAQGFLFGEPMTAEQARQMIAPDKVAAAR
jgi:EAL domain-containing protein (putative c-di-GMP-specific phosphodiesterase class I)